MKNRLMNNEFEPAECAGIFLSVVAATGMQEIQL